LSRGEVIAATLLARDVFTREERPCARVPCTVQATPRRQRTGLLIAQNHKVLRLMRPVLCLRATPPLLQMGAEPYTAH
jgi:hypothetical protein